MSRQQMHLIGFRKMCCTFSFSLSSPVRVSTWSWKIFIGNSFLQEPLVDFANTSETEIEIPTSFDQYSFGFPSPNCILFLVHQLLVQMDDNQSYLFLSYNQSANTSTFVTQISNVKIQFSKEEIFQKIEIRCGSVSCSQECCL